MANPIHLSQAQQPAKNNREQELEFKVKELEEENERLIGNNYINSLSDDKTFRLELLRSLTMITKSINELKEKLTELTSGGELTAQ
jgi:hypothetical protein